jgi:cytochrome b involved in lipid metabolism
MSAVYSTEDVLKHATEEDCWLIIGNDSNGGQKVYNISKYMNDHPGGPEIMMEFAGKDADDMFEDIGHSSEARQKMKEFLIGSLKADPNAAKKPAGKKVIAEHKSKGGLNPLAVVALLVAIAVGYYYSQIKK